MTQRRSAVVALRMAAAEWGEGLKAPVVDSKDSGSARLDRRLQRAAIAFAGKLPAMAKRGYSRDFKPHGDTGKRYLLDEIPAGLWAAVREKCKREGVSIRALILKLLKDWVGR